MNLIRIVLVVLLWGTWAYTGTAQLTGKWTGKVVIEEENSYSWLPILGNTGYEYYYELVLTQKGNQITGYSVTHFGKDYAKTKVIGEVSGNKVHIKEVAIIEDRVSSGNTYWCFFDMYLVLGSDKDKLTLKGPYKSYSATDGSPCGPGKVELTAPAIRA